MNTKLPASFAGALALAVLAGIGTPSAQTQSLEGSRWTGGITNTSTDSICRSFGAHRIGDGSGWQLAAEIRDERLKGLLTAKPGNKNRHEYKVSAYVGPGRRLERGTMIFGQYIAKFDGDVQGDRFEAKWDLSAAGEVNCRGTIFMNRVK
ncbi:MAG: hypothetical protein OEN55_08785 [Alphaproteobacteria bacterium]|nr:hypothetical protein [Alphaproteobacteria bacterium]